MKFWLKDNFSNNGFLFLFYRTCLAHVNKLPMYRRLWNKRYIHPRGFQTVLCKYITMTTLHFKIDFWMPHFCSSEKCQQGDSYLACIFVSSHVCQHNRLYKKKDTKIIPAALGISFERCQNNPHRQVSLKERPMCAPVVAEIHQYWAMMFKLITQKMSLVLSFWYLIYLCITLIKKNTF